MKVTEARDKDEKRSWRRQRWRLLGERAAVLGARGSPRRGADPNLSAGTEFGARWEASAQGARKPGGYFRCNCFLWTFWLTSIVSTRFWSWGRGSVPPAACDGFLGQSLRCCPGRQKQAGVQPRGSLPPFLMMLSIARLPRTASGCKSQVAYSFCFSVSVSVVFTFFDLWTMKCFPEE